MTAIQHTLRPGLRHLFNLLLIVTVCLAASPAVPADDHSDLAYTIRCEWAEGNRQLVVTLSFTGENDGTTILRLPHAWAWQNSYDEGIKDLAAVSERASVIRLSDDYACEVRHVPSARVTVRYRVIQYWDEPITRDVYYRPILGADYFHFIGHGVFVYPDGDMEKRRRIILTWDSLPDSWKLANSFGVMQKSQVIERSLSELCHAVYLGGNITVHQIDISGHPIYIASYGQWRFALEDFYALVGETVKAVRGYWNDYDFPYFLVTVISTDEACCSKGGTGLTNSYGLFISSETEDIRRLTFLLTHELFHTWNGRKITRQEPEELVYWFAEGFTDYFTRLILLRSQLITLQDYVDDINLTLRELYQSPARNIANKEILERTHTDPEVEKIPYWRGDLLALRWDAAIRRSSGGAFSLDNLMKDLLVAAGNSNLVVSPANIDSLIRPYLPGGVMNDLRQYIDKGRTMEPGGTDLGPCVSLGSREISPFDLGFTYRKPADGEPWLIAGVDSQSAAFAAGLRDGQKLIERSVYWGRTDKPVELGVQEESGETKKIEYYPQGKPISIPQYRLNLGDYGRDSTGCLQWLGL